MFDQNDQTQQSSNGAPAVQATVQNTTTPDLGDMSLPANNSSASISDTNTPSAPIPQDTSAPAQDTTTTGSTSSLTSPADNTTALDSTSSAIDSTSTPVVPTSIETTSNLSASEPSAVGDPNLLNIKKDALQNLTPLLDHLDQTPEEKFRTTMMLIQASDDQSLVQSAYNAAKSIEDEKVRAQALLDIVNEINYFTQNSEEKAS